MADPGFVPGFIGVGIQMAVYQILHHINIAVRCRKELSALGDVVREIEPIVRDIQQYRLEINRRRRISTSPSDNNVSAVNLWLQNLDALLLQASQMAEQCTISSFNIFSRYQTSIKIANLKLDIDNHLKSVDSVGAYSRGSSSAVHAQGKGSSASTSMQAIAPSAEGFFIEEPLIVGQEDAFAVLERFVMEAEEEGSSLFRIGVVGSIGVVGKGGAGKTLLLRTVFNSPKVRNLFKDDLLLWLTVSNNPSFTNLRNELCMQIATLTKIDLDRNQGDEYAKRWLSQRLQTQRFALFLDDVWRDGSQLMEELGLLLLTHRSNCRVVISSRYRTVLSEIGVSETSVIRMGDLVEEDSWQLFSNYAFPYNNRKLPANIDEKTAKIVCANCGGLPLAIKVVGRAMAARTHLREWEWAARTHPISDSHQQAGSSHQLYDRLRLSYDALANHSVNLQICFLYAAAAFREDEIIQVEYDVIPLWSGEGLLGRKKQPEDAVSDPLEMGSIYVEVLAYRCLIEPMMRDIDGRVVCFRIHDVIRTLGIQIAEREEGFYCRVGMGLTALPKNEWLGCTRMLLNRNEMSSLPESLGGPAIRSLLMYANRHFTKIPKRVIGSMTSLRVLDLSATSLSSLPNSVGCLKQLASLRLRGVPIRRLPPSLVNLVNLETLDLSYSSIMELPPALHKLRSLKYLYLRNCTDLQYLPRNISRLTSLQCLDMYKCSRLWTKVDQKNRWKKVASIHNLGSLTHLKKFVLESNGEQLQEGTLRNMVEMETLQLKITNMESLPQDMGEMIKLKKLWLEFSSLVKMESNFFKFQNLSFITLFGFSRLEELPHLHKLGSLRELRVIKCSKIHKFPKEFGEPGAFPLLEVLSLVRLDELEELPLIYEGAMPSLKIFTIMQCEALKMLPESYFTIKKLQKISVFGCSMMVLENLERVKIENKWEQLQEIRMFGCSMVLENLESGKIENNWVQVLTMSSTDTRELLEEYLQARSTIKGLTYDEFFWWPQLLTFLNYCERPL